MELDSYAILTVQNQKALQNRELQKIRIALANSCMFTHSFFHGIFALQIPQDERTH